jgi:nucleoside-diphosphate-sugar epimerase
VAVLTVPATYPPEDVNGVMVSGFDSPLATAIDGSFVSPRRFYPEIRRLVGRLPFADFQELTAGPGWHAEARAPKAKPPGATAEWNAELGRVVRSGGRVIVSNPHPFATELLGWKPTRSIEETIQDVFEYEKARLDVHRTDH